MSLLLASSLGCADEGPAALTGSLPPRAEQASCRFVGQPTGVLQEVMLGEPWSRSVLPGAFEATPVFGQTSDWWVAAGETQIQRLSESGATQLALDLSAGNRTLLDLASHPAHPGQLFVAYRISLGSARVVRFSQLPDGSLDAGSELSVVQGDPSPSASLAFDAQGLLFIAFADTAVEPQQPSEAANALSAAGTVLRIDVTMPEQSGGYAIPPSNPHGNAFGLAEEGPIATYATGMRAPAGCAVDAQGALWCADRGLSSGELHRVAAAGDLGWPQLDGRSCTSPPCDPELERQPQALVALSPGCSFELGGVHRQGILDNTLYLAACDHIHGMMLDPPDKVFRLQPLLDEPADGFAHSDDDVLLVWQQGRARPIERVHASGTFPQLLSETGCFTGPRLREPGAALVPFEVNAPLWSDGSDKHRWLQLPAEEHITADDDGWHFPVGSVLLKRFDHRVEGQLQPVETRVMIRRSFGWEFHAYQWNAQATEAALLDSFEQVTVSGEDGTLFEHTIPSRGSCAACHGDAQPRALGPTTAQLRRIVHYPNGGAHQLEAMAAIGLFGSAGVPAAEPVLVDFREPGGPVPERARAYLHANCAYCHQPGGWAPGVLQMDLRYDRSLLQANICGQDAMFGTIGYLLQPGFPEQSRIYQRLSVRGLQQMPPLATERIDPLGVELVGQWIEQLQSCPAP